MIHISDEVQSALASGLPVVALESTVIAHGLPYPSNVETATALESVIRKAGAVPATIAVINGEMKIGLSTYDIEHLAKGEGIAKLGTRDLPSAVSSRLDGATTVSATSFIAAKAGIEVFATGGIGGVHRGAGQTFDISADLWELASTRIMVVCAGAKAILDLPSTLEWLETHQVPVCGLGTSEFPGFYSRSTGLMVDKADLPEEIARRFAIQKDLGMKCGMLVGVPIPKESELQLDTEIAQVIAEVELQGVTGKAVTPWMLARLKNLTGGRSVASNIALLMNNARAAAEIACALARSKS